MMKMKTTIAALLAVPLLATFASGQNLFRTGRPDYTRDYAATYHDRYTNQAMPQPGPRYPSNFDSVRQNNMEQERLQLAWENYRREANRYQARYGGSTNYADSGASRYSPSSYSPSGYSPIAPVGYDSDVRPRCRQNSVPTDGYDNSLRRPPVRPSGYYRNSDYYGSGNATGSGYGNRDFTSTTTDWNRTASRPFTSLLDSLFGTNR